MDTTTTTTASGLKTLTPFSPFSPLSPFRMRSSKVPLFRSLCSAHLHRSSRLYMSSARFSPLCSLSAAAADGIGSRGECFLANGVGEAVKEEQVSQRKILQVVLVSPQIPGNTGCIARTCAASAVGLHLVGPLGFKIDDAKLKRAGLDYWPYPNNRCYVGTSTLKVKMEGFISRAKLYVVVKVHSSWAEFQDYFRQQEGEKRLLAFTKRGTKFHSDFSYRRGDFLIFGSETSGLPPEALEDCKSETIGGGTIRIPMVETYVRCLNLSVSVGIALYEAARQLNYEQLDFPNENCIDSEKSFVTEDIFA